MARWDFSVVADHGWENLEAELAGDRYLTASQTAARSGLDPDRSRQVLRAMGFVDTKPDEALFSDRDVEMLTGIRRIVDSGILDFDSLLSLTRATCHAQAHVAEAHAQVIVERAALLGHSKRTQDVAAGAPDTDPIVSATERALAPLESFVAYTWRRHLLDALSREATRPSQHAPVPMAIGFADLVGFTALTESGTALEAGALIARFEALAYDRVVGGGGRVVKMIGDEVFFAVDSAQACTAVGIGLITACSQDPGLPDVRVGLAVGPVLAQGGDLLGRPVNLASRLAKLAEPATALASNELADALTSSNHWHLQSHAPQLVKGIGWVPSVSITPSDQEVR